MFSFELGLRFFAALRMTSYFGSLPKACRDAGLGFGQADYPDLAKLVDGIGELGYFGGHNLEKYTTADFLKTPSNY